MPEYLIWTTAGPGSRPAIPEDRLLDVLQPRGYGSVSVEGRGDLRLALGGCEMALSGEDAGWRVWFEGDTADHDTGILVAQVARQVHEFTGEHIKWIRCD
jgi:hypothetical protein